MSLDPRRRKILFRATHRGTKEADRLVGGFAEARLETLDERLLDQFEALLEAPDPDLVDWITQRRPAPALYEGEMLSLMIETCTNLNVSRPDIS